MSDTKAFDVTELKPGDPVTIERYCEHGWNPWDSSRVIAIHDDGTIELEGNRRFGPDGRQLLTSLRYRLRPAAGAKGWDA